MRKGQVTRLNSSKKLCDWWRVGRALWRLPGRLAWWALRDDMTASLVVDALRTRRRQFKARTKDFRDTLEEYDITPSMSMRGNCWNNAVRIVES
jgi:transposase InsO family protein